MGLQRILSMLLHSATTLAFSLGATRDAFSHHHEHPLLSPSPRGKLEGLTETPSKLFNSILCILIFASFLFKIVERWMPAAMPTRAKRNKPRAIKSLQARFLAVFWLIKCADWLQGPYFYELYASKVSNCFIISKLFVTGFASAALFGPMAGRISDTFGRKRATLAFCVLYSLGAASTKSSFLCILFLGRVLSGIGTSLMFTAPESWLVAESKQHDKDPDGTYLEETFGLAYAVDSIVAIAAGQLSLAAASKRGLTGPFELSIVFLCIGGLLILFLWSENVAHSANDDNNKEHKPLIQDALHIIYDNPAILLLGAAQSLFEACMYIFIMQWPPSINDAVHAAYGATAETPYGTVLSCFMASCLIGATMFGHLSKLGIPTEEATALMLTVAALAMGSATTAVSTAIPSLASLIISFLVFEGCVGMYFPSTSALRSKYIPDAHRSIIMSLFGIPLNVLVVTVFLASERLGVRGALGIATAFLNVAAMSTYKLHSMKRRASPTITFK